MTGIVVPKLNSNDAAYTLIEWLHPDGGHVAEGEPIAVLETSKATQELAAPRRGVLHRMLHSGAECRVGEFIGHLFDSEEDRLQFAGGQPDELVAESNGLVITQAAEGLANRLGLNRSDLARLGKPVVRRKDVEQFEGPRPARSEKMEYVPTRVQRAVAEAVSRSHTTQPAAFTVVVVYADVLGRFRRSAGSQGPIGVAELLVKVLAGLVDRFPLFFSTRGADDRVWLPDDAHVGITIDAGSGLYVPVIRNAGTHSLDQLEHRLAAFRRSARHGTYQDEELQGGNIMLAMHDYSCVEFAIPLIHPGHSCALSVGGQQHELALDDADAVVRRPCFKLCLAYDHRLINGRDAAIFLRELKLTLESADRLQALVN